VPAHGGARLIYPLIFRSGVGCDYWVY